MVKLNSSFVAGIISITILILIIAPTTMAVEITPETIDINLVGGNVTTKEIEIKNTESYSIKCKLSTIISPDDIGINVTYSKSKFTIQPHSIYTLEMIINTSIMLEPNIYTINTTIEFIDEKKTDDTQGDSSDDGSSSSDHTDIPDVIIPDVTDDIPEEEEIPEDEEEIPDDNNITITPDKTDKHDYSKTIFLIIIIVLALILTLIFVIKMKKRKK